jgi:hypothetical protein
METIKNMLNANTKTYLFLFLVSVFMLGANPFKSETIAPMDLLVKYPGWQNTGIKVSHINGERSDVLDARLPIWLSAKKSLYNGDFPTWNHQRAGKPALIFTNSLFTPAFLTFVLVKNDAVGFYLSNLVNVLIGLAGMLFFLRIFVGWSAASFGAFVFMFSGFNSAWFFWAHVNTAIWTPWVLFAVYKFIDTKEKKYLPLVTVTMFMLNMGGFPMVSVMTFISTAFMVLIYLVANKTSVKYWISTLSYLLLFSLLSVLIAVPFIYPLAELLEWIGGMGYRSIGSGFKSYEYQLFFNPNFYRYPRVESTFYVGILPLVFLFMSIIIYSLKPKLIAFLGLLLFLFAVSISFAIVPLDVIREIPALNSSLITRFGYLIGLSLAIISAFVVHEIFDKFKDKKWILALISVLFIIQILDQRKLFHAFNDHVPNNSFYPKTKSLSYLQKNLHPLQHVVADNGYIIAGLLGGYGLNDWYAHSFHTAAEKEILRKIVNKPFKTPTSAMFDFSQINIGSKYIDYLGIKAILSTSFSTDNHIQIWDNERKQKPCPNMPAHSLVQKFNIEKSTKTTGIAVKMATYGQFHAFSDVLMVLRKGDKVIERMITDKNKITDNAWISFKFKERSILEKGIYDINISMVDTKDAKPLTIWSNINENTYKLMVDGAEQPLSLKMVLTEEKYLDEKYKLLNLEPNIYILENLNVKEGAYFMAELNESHTIDNNNISTVLLSDAHIKITYTDNKSGWVVLPMRSYPGWKASIEGKTIPIKKFLGMLPAIRVEGKSNIDFKYAPEHNTYTYPLSLLGLLMLLFSIYRFTKKD